VAAAEQDPADAAFSVSRVPTRYHPLKQFVAGPDGLARHAVAEGARIVNRQQLGDVFIRNGLCYAVRRTAIDAGRDMLGTAAALVIVDGPVVNIDDPEDLELARRLIETP
jgi:CMP-N-acetylneuraminic acid synthetase